MKYQHLFEPIQVSGNTLPNRVVMGSMHTGLEETKGGFERMATFYAERAKGEVGLIVTGGFSPDLFGGVSPFASQLSYFWQVSSHRKITDAVHKNNGKIVLQILHAGRYSYHPFAVAPSAIKSPISPFKPWRLSKWGIRGTIKSFINCARLAKKAGYDGVEVMGSEGYLINQFIAKRTNHRTDEWGGSYENRIRLALEIVKGIRKACGPDFILIYRLSMMDLVSDGSTFDEVSMLAKKIEQAGASIINTGIGWHEARVPTIATVVPRGAFLFVTRKIKAIVDIPVIAANRFNEPDIANRAIKDGSTDFISMARPLLADAAFVKKAHQDRADEINTCIACNQACLDHIFERKIASCLVNPRACYEKELEVTLAVEKKHIVVVGAGPAGLSCAETAASRGHRVTLIERSEVLGGQFNLAKQIPGKAEFAETIRYFKRRLEILKVDVKLGVEANFELIKLLKADQVVIATGVTPRQPEISGIESDNVYTYLQVLNERPALGEKVAIIGAGGIGYDIAQFLIEDGREQESGSDLSEIQSFFSHWGIDGELQSEGALREPKLAEPRREIYLMQRSSGKPGARLGKTTGWIHRKFLKDSGVKTLSGVKYLSIGKKGIEIEHQETQQTLKVNSIVVCAGQSSDNKLYKELQELGISNISLIGGAQKAAELDAKAAIKDGIKLALQF